MTILDQVFEQSQLWGGAGGRDYIRIEDSIFSVNAVNCEKDGSINRWGRFVRVMDVRWVVVDVGVVDGVLSFRGDKADLQALEHWGYRLEGRTVRPGPR